MIVPAQIRALIVDDNSFALKTLGAGLRKLGLERITEAVGGAAGLSALLTAPFDVALIDWYMPEVSGAGLMEVVQAVSAARGQLHPDATRTDFIVVTAYASPEMAALARALGVREILPKPFTDRQLGAVLARVVTGRSHEQADAGTSRQVRL